MKYRIFKIEHGIEEPVGKLYSEDELEEANRIAAQLNRNRNKGDPYFHVSKIFEVIRCEE